MVEILPSDVSYPLSPEVARMLFSEYLNKHEKEEILNYSDVYFVGQVANKDQYDRMVESEGYDDRKGSYRVVAHDHIAYRYEVLKVLGKGSFGQVIKCFDHKRKVTVAVKIIKNNKKFFKQAEIEERILRHMKEHNQNSEIPIVQMHESFVFRSHFVLLAHN